MAHDEEDEDEPGSHWLGHFEASKREPAFAVREGNTPAAWEGTQ